MKKFNLLIHPGFSKTATSWMQESIFPNLKKCIYLGKSGMAKKLYEHQYKLFNPLYCSTKYTARNSEELISRYVEVLREEMIQRSSKLENDSYFILSDEAIFDYTNYNAELNTFLLKSVLNKLRDSLESFCEISISILITFREQYSLLRSSYAHGYSLLVDRFPTFDKFLKYGIKNPYSQLFGCLWYDQIYTQLKSVYKEERVIMVPYEFLHENPAVFLEKSLLNFGVSDLDELKKISYLVGDKPININHTDMGVYNLRGRTNWHRLTRYAWQKTDHIDPETKFLSFLKFAKHLLDPFFKTGVVIKGTLVDGDDQNKKKIQDIYGNSNRLLSDMICVDLGALGYSIR